MTTRSPTLAFGRPLALTRPPLCPEIELWLLDGQVDLEQACRDLDECHPPPYWAFCWGAGQALARFVLDEPEWVRGRHVVDFGAGGGVVSIAAALSGATRVTAVDTDPAALAATRRNATQNGVLVGTSPRVPDDGDLLLAADVLYEVANQAGLRNHRSSGSPVLISDPERAGSPAPTNEPLRRYAATTLPDVDSPMRSATIYLL